MKNRAVLPRTAGLRTLSELTTGLTKAGLDPSRIQERAEMLAKVAGAKRKRQREEEDAEMEVDEEAPATGVDGFGVGALDPFLAVSRWPSLRKCEDTARAPAAAAVAFGAMAS